MNSNTTKSIPEIRVEALNIATRLSELSHNELTGRDSLNQHPVSAIKGLQEQLDLKANVKDLKSKVSELENDAQYVNLTHSHNSENSNAVSYNDLSDKPVIPTKLSELENDLTLGAASTTEQAYTIVSEDTIVFNYATSIYKKSIMSNTTLIFDSSALTNSNSVATFELWLEVCAGELTVTLPDLTWVGETPDFSSGMNYIITLRFDSGDIYANLAYTTALKIDGPVPTPAS